MGHVVCCRFEDCSLRELAEGGGTPSTKPRVAIFCGLLLCGLPGVEHRAEQTKLSIPDGRGAQSWHRSRKAAWVFLRAVCYIEHRVARILRIARIAGAGIDGVAPSGHSCIGFPMHVEASKFRRPALVGDLLRRRAAALFDQCAGGDCFDNYSR